MKNLKFLALLALLPLVGCTDSTSPEVVAVNAQTLSGDGTYMGTLPDGRNVVRYIISRGDAGYDHYVYVTNGSTTVNTRVPAGKTTRPQVTVLINGECYQKVNKE